jgi:hypothetical protein
VVPDGAVYRTDTSTAVADGLDTPQGIAVVGKELFVVETGRRRALGIGLTDGHIREIAINLPVGPPPRSAPALFAHGLPGVPRPFAGLAAAPDGTLYLDADADADADGTILHLDPFLPRIA